MQDACNLWTQLNDSTPHEFSQHPPGVREVMGSILVRNADFFFVPRSSQLTFCSFTYQELLCFQQLSKLTLYFSQQVI